MTATFSLQESAAILCGSDSPAKCQWLVLRLRRGELPGYKSGRQWRMTQEDIDTAIEKLRPRQCLPEVPMVSGLTRTSQRRLAAWEREQGKETA